LARYGIGTAPAKWAAIRYWISSYFKNRANTLRFMGQYDRAIADYRKALTLNIDERMKKEIDWALKELGAETH
jgi:tetratricopeptide (TPR) repeat protein